SRSIASYPTRRSSDLLAKVGVEVARDGALEADEPVVPFPPGLGTFRLARPVRFLVRFDRRIEGDAEEVLRSEVRRPGVGDASVRSEEHTPELQSPYEI